MTRETDPNTSFIGDFQNTAGVVDLPETDGTILVSEVDDQIRDAKQMVFNTFKSCNGEVTADHTELSYVDGTEQNLALWTKGQTASGLAIATGDSGTPNTYTLTTGLSHTLADGDAFTFQCDEASTGASLLEVDSNTARNLVDKTGGNIGAGDISIDSVVEVRYDASAQKFYVIGGITAGSTPTPTSAFYTAGDNAFTATVTGDHTFELIGGGGGGGAGGGSPGGCGGGGGGGYLRVVLPLTIGDVITCTVGAGGRGFDPTNNGEDGQRTEILLEATQDIYFALPGLGGQSRDAGGAGGSGGNGGGTDGPGPFESIVTRVGGDGGDGGPGGVGQVGAGGGSAAGSSANGNDGQDGSFGVGGAGSAGAAGGAFQGGNGEDAPTPTKLNVESGGGGGGGNGTSDLGGGYAGNYGSGGGATGNSSSLYRGGNGQNGVIHVDWS